MSLRKRGKFWHYEAMVDGQRIWGSTKQTTKSAAMTVLAEKIKNARDGSCTPRISRTPTLAELSVRFLQFNQDLVHAQKLSPNTKRYYEYGWKLLAGTEVARLRVDQITKSVAAILSFAGSPSNANMALRTLRRMLHQAEEWQLIRATPRINTVEEIGRTALIEAGHESLLLHAAPHPLREILLIIMDSGMRPEEAMRLRWDNVFWDRRVILVSHGKTARSKRYVPLSDRVRDALRELQRSNSSPWVFPSKRAHGGHRTTVGKQWAETLIAANERAGREGKPLIPENTVLYCARHTFATDMLSHVDVVQVSELLGHADLATTRKYCHPDTSGAADAINQRNSSRRMHLVKGKSNYDKTPDIAMSEAV